MTKTLADRSIANNSVDVGQPTPGRQAKSAFGEPNPGRSAKTGNLREYAAPLRLLGSGQAFNHREYMNNLKLYMNPQTSITTSKLPPTTSLFCP